MIKEQIGKNSNIKIIFRIPPFKRDEIVIPINRFKIDKDKKR